MNPNHELSYIIYGGDAMTQNQTINVTVELDRIVKESGEALFRSLGVNFSAAINTLVIQAVRRGQIDEAPNFDTELAARDPVFDRATQTEIRRRFADVKAGRNYRGRELLEVND